MGGNVFEGNTSSIKKEYIEPTMREYIKELGRIFPENKDNFNKYFRYLGSVGKKDISGDIDLSVDLDLIFDPIVYIANSIDTWNSNLEDFELQYQKYKKRARTATHEELRTRTMMKLIVDSINSSSDSIHCDEKKIGSGGIFCKFPQYNDAGEKLNEFVQIDWMVGKPEWLKFAYYSESYEGNVKGLHRTQLLLAMFDNLGYSFGHTKGVIEKETRTLVAKTPERAIEILEEGYNIVFQDGDIDNYFKLFELIKNMEHETKKHIFNIYLKILDRTRCDIPLNLQNYWFTRKEELGLTGKFLPEDSNLVEKRIEA